AGLTEWREPAPGLWRAAMTAATPPGRMAHRIANFASRRARAIAAAACLLVAVGIAGFLVVPALNSTSSPRVSPDLWSLVYSRNSTPKQFTCPTAATDPSASSVANFDFRKGVSLSYGYQQSRSAGEAGPRLEALSS